MSDLEKLQGLLRDYKSVVFDMATTQVRYDKEQDEETLKVLNFAKYVVSCIETKIIDMYLMEGDK